MSLSGWKDALISHAKGAAKRIAPATSYRLSLRRLLDRVELAYVDSCGHRSCLFSRRLMTVKIKSIMNSAYANVLA
jgi:hypothetical protein